MRSIIVGLFILFVVAFLSCQKELSQARPNQAKNNLLSKISTYSSGYTYIDSFAFDAQDRCTRLYRTIIDSFSTGSITVYNQICDFHYNGDETSPYKMTGNPEGRNFIWWIFYDNLGRKIIDSSIYPGTNDFEVVKYAYSGNLITANRNGQYLGRDYHSVDSFDFDGQNCTKWRALVFEGLIPRSWHISMLHDSHINPISELNISKSVLFGANGTLGDYKGLNQNNYLSQLVKYTDGSYPGDILVKLEYQYDSFGRPILYMSHSQVNPSWFWIVKYEYNK